jgi:hypothetical protein
MFFFMDQGSEFKQSRGTPFRENRTTATELEAFRLSSLFVESKRDVFIPDVLAEVNEVKHTHLPYS